MIGIFATFLILSVAPHQAAVPGVEARNAARAAVAAGACPRLGYVASPQAQEIVVGRYLAQLRTVGVEDARAARLLSDAVAVESASLDALSEQLDGASGEVNREVAASMRAYLTALCGEVKERFPGVFEHSASEGREFSGHLGLWLDFPIVEEASFYLLARGNCANNLPAFDIEAVADQLSAPFAEEPSQVVAALREAYVEEYRRGLAVRPRLDPTQCRRLMVSANEAISTAWSNHYRNYASPPTLGLE